MADAKPVQTQNSSHAVATSADVDAFLANIRQQRSTATGRLIFGLDATASRSETWKMACQLQAEMFRVTSSVGGLNLQLVYYRGRDECRHSKWVAQPEHLAGLMEKIECKMGHTQIGKVLDHAKKETGILKVSALVLIADAMEEEADDLAGQASELGRLGVPAFIFQEGTNKNVERTFRTIAEYTHGAYGRFDEGSAKQLGALLRAVAIYAVGGIPALAARKDEAAIKLLGQLK